MNRQEDFRHILSLVLHVPSSAINQYSTEVAREVIIRVLFCLDVSRRYQSLEFETRRRALWFPITRYSFVSKKVSGATHFWLCNVTNRLLIQCMTVHKE